MVEYIPPPADLSKLNPIQRYMQKGSLEWQDYIRLIALVGAYWLLRPFIQKFFKHFSGPEFQEGEQEQLEYLQRRIKAVVEPNDIREGSKSSKGAPVKTLGQILEEGAVTSSSAVGATPNKDNEIKSRKAQKLPQKPVSSAGQDVDTADIEKVLDWEDERAEDLNPDQTSEGQNDIAAWVDKWTQ